MVFAKGHERCAHLNNYRVGQLRKRDKYLKLEAAN